MFFDFFLCGEFGATGATRQLSLIYAANIHRSVAACATQHYFSPFVSLEPYSTENSRPYAKFVCLSSYISGSVKHLGLQGTSIPDVATQVHR